MYTTLLTSIIITIVPVGFYTNHGQCGTDWYGDYNISTHEIRICHEEKEVLYHEVGHHFWYAKLSEQDKKNYEKLYKRAKVISVNGKKGVHEDFADAFALRTNNRIIKGYEQRIAFIKRIEKKYK